MRGFTDRFSVRILPGMGRILRLSLRGLTTTLACLLAAAFAAPAQAESVAPFELNFTKGDTREGSKVRIRVIGDSIHWSRTVFEPGRDAVETSYRDLLDIRRKIALKRVLGELPRFQVFGSCFGKGMRYYLLDTPGGKFYRSVPERSGRCFSDEPGIWMLLEDLDSFIDPPVDPRDPDFSASAPRS